MPLHEDAVRKGQYLYYEFKRAGGQSPHIHPNELAAHGWVKVYQNMTGGPPIPGDTNTISMYNDLRISTLAEHNVRNCWEHQNRTFRQGRWYEATGGFYECVYNPQAILALNSESFGYRGIDFDFDADDIVSLQHWSDVMSLEWGQFCWHRRQGLSSLRYIFQSNVTNNLTAAIVDEALYTMGWDRRPWINPRNDPGARTFPLDSPQGLAILASRNGVGPLHLLTQHKVAMGFLTITAITAFWRQCNLKQRPKLI